MSRGKARWQLNKQTQNPAQSNSDYGNGIYRRRIRVENYPQRVVAELEDVTHAFRLTLHHDGRVVNDVTAQPIRYPFDTCPGAVDRLRPLLGMPLAADARSLRETLQPGQNCTHLYDLALLAIAHAARTERQRLFDIAVPDERENGALLELNRDGATVHQWLVQNHRIVEPVELAGNPMMQGFFQWASKAFSEDLLESALVLQRGYFVAQVRRSDYMHAGGRPAAADNMPDGACYTYNSPVVHTAVHTYGMARDFSASAEQLLKFV
jgi:hypothetical protein